MHPHDQGVIRTLGVDDQMQLVGSPHFGSPTHFLLPHWRPQLAALACTVLALIAVTSVDLQPVGEIEVGAEGFIPPRKTYLQALADTVLLSTEARYWAQQ